MSTPGCVKLRHFEELSLVSSQIFDFLSSPPSRPGSCILSLFQSRPWPAAWRRSRRGEPPPGKPGCQLSGSGAGRAPSTSCPRPCRLRAGWDRGSGTKEPYRRIRSGTKSASVRVPACPHPGGATHLVLGAACPPCPWVKNPCCCSAPSPSQHRVAAPVPGTGGQAEGSWSAGGWFCSITSPGGAGPNVALGWTRTMDVQKLVPVRNGAETPMWFPRSLQRDCVGSWGLAAFLSNQ